MKLEVKFVEETKGALRKLKDSLDSWYERGTATVDGSPTTSDEEGEWGGTLHDAEILVTTRNLFTGRRLRSELQVRVDWGSAEKLDEAVSELKRVIDNSGYNVVRGRCRAGVFYLTTKQPPKTRELIDGTLSEESAYLIGTKDD